MAEKIIKRQQGNCTQKSQRNRTLRADKGRLTENITIGRKETGCGLTQSTVHGGLLQIGYELLRSTQPKCILDKQATINYSIKNVTRILLKIPIYK